MHSVLLAAKRTLQLGYMPRLQCFFLFSSFLFWKYFITLWDEIAHIYVYR